MTTTKIMKNFNVEKYNEKMAELDNAIKIVNEYIREYRTWYPDESITPQFIQQLFTFPTKIFNKLVQFALQSRIRTSGTGSVELPNSIQYYQLRITRDAANAALKEAALTEILPYVKESYGKLFKLRVKENDNYDFDDVVLKTKNAERLIMEQCIEWEEDYTNEVV